MKNAYNREKKKCMIKCQNTQYTCDKIVKRCQNSIYKDVKMDSDCHPETKKEMDCYTVNKKWIYSYLLDFYTN